MTAVLKNADPSAIVVEATEADLQEAMRRAFERAGVSSYGELEAQAHARRFTSTAARLAWLAFRDLDKVRS